MTASCVQKLLWCLPLLVVAKIGACIAVGQVQQVPWGAVWSGRRHERLGRLGIGKAHGDMNIVDMLPKMHQNFQVSMVCQTMQGPHGL